ncbi:MAG: AAA family ATPase [Candidatus Dojkabacteria bacterium]
MERKNREKDLGYLFVVGGPGGSGSSTISKMLAEYFNLERIYAGEIFREFTKRKGYASFEDFYIDGNEDDLIELDKEVDTFLVGKATSVKNVLIESKIFSGISEKKDIQCTVKIWITASSHVRALRHVNKLKYSNIFAFLKSYFVTRRNQDRRWKLDSKRYKELYDIDYSNIFMYNDIVIDSSHLNEDETFKLILKEIENGEYIK